MTVRCVRVELAPESRARVKEWAAEILRRRPEALATLQQEGVTVESVFLEAVAGTDYLVYYMRAQDMKRALAAGRTIADDIQRYHRQFQKDTWRAVTELELLLDLTVTETEPAGVVDDE